MRTCVSDDAGVHVLLTLMSLRLWQQNVGAVVFAELCSEIDYPHVRLRSRRHQYESSESRFPFTDYLSLVQASPARVTCTSTQLNACLLTISSEIKSSECFAKQK